MVNKKLKVLNSDDFNDYGEFIAAKKAVEENGKEETKPEEEPQAGEGE